MRLIIETIEKTRLIVSEGQFNCAQIAEHKHRDTDFIVPTQSIIFLGNNNKFRITENDFNAIANSKHDAIILVREIKELPEHQLCGYSTLEDFEAKKEEIRKQNEKKIDEQKAFIEAKREARKASKKVAKGKKKK